MIIKEGRATEGQRKGMFKLRLGRVKEGNHVNGREQVYQLARFRARGNEVEVGRVWTVGY